MRERKYKLNPRQRREIRGMLQRGDRTQDIAYWFQISPSTVSGIRHNMSESEWRDDYTDLPKPGPYQIVREVVLVELQEKATAYDEMRAKQEAASLVVSELERLLVRYKTICGRSTTDHIAQA